MFRETKLTYDDVFKIKNLIQRSNSSYVSPLFLKFNGKQKYTTVFVFLVYQYHTTKTTPKY